MKRVFLVLGALGTLAVSASAAVAESETVINPEAAASEEIAPGVQARSEQEIPIEEVPEAALSAAKDALQKEPSKAYRVTLISGDEVYELESRSGTGEEAAVYVTASGEIVESGEESEPQNTPQPQIDIEAALQNAAKHLEEVQGLDQVDSVMVVQIEEALRGGKTGGVLEIAKESDTSAVRDFLEGDSPVANAIKEELKEAGIDPGQVVALTVRDPQVVIALIRRSQ